MATPDESLEDIFLPGGRLRADVLTDGATSAMKESLRLAKETRWDSVRSPHVFMGLLSVPDASICNLFGKGGHVGPAARDTRCGRACHRDLWNFSGPKRRLDDTRDRTALDAMRTRVFRVHRRVRDWLPGRLRDRESICRDIISRERRGWHWLNKSEM